MKKTVLFTSLFLIFSVIVLAQTQQPAISWDKTTHNFGSFKEEDGTQTATFTFTNTGSMPLYITNVKASCGCTATEYTKEPVQPGGKGFVKATYDPRNRPGKFNKSVTVTANTENPTTMLRIEGDVSPREKGIEDFYPKAFGDVRLRTSHLAFTKVYNNQTVTDTIGIVNMGADPVTITFENVPEHIAISVKPEKLAGKKPNEKAGEFGVITVTYNGQKKNDWGFVMDRVDFVINGEKVSQNRLSISATIEEDFSHLTADELANAPKAEFESTEFQFGTIKSGEKSTYNFVFKNTGKSDLVIRKIKASCGCTATNPEKMIIKPGESSHITATFNSAGKRGNQNKTITVITNDPSQSSVVLKIIGTVEEVKN
ncbi:MAG: DUF1573 domain-containing protein [Bacteroidales bacterium]|nr:DUF1573 domain-containing protein [Bacteroidales bacterium]